MGSLKRCVYLALKSCLLALCFVSFQEWVIIYKSFTHVHTQTQQMDKFRSFTIESDGLCRATPKAPHDPWAPKSSWSTRFCPPHWSGIHQSWTLGSCWSWRPKLHLYTWDPLHRGNPYIRIFFMVVVTNNMERGQEGVGQNIYFCIEATNRLVVVQ